jgi:hypothetical protein
MKHRRRRKVVHPTGFLLQMTDFLSTSFFARLVELGRKKVRRVHENGNHGKTSRKLVESIQICSTYIHQSQCMVAVFTGSRHHIL